MCRRRIDCGPSRRVAGIGLIAIVLIFGAQPTRAEFVHLEDPLSCHRPLLNERHRLTLGTDYYGAHNWTGLRNSIRYEAARGEVVDWAITLPWLYSSWRKPGNSGRDNLHLGGSLRLLGPGRGYLRLTTDFWLAFSDDALYPLQQRRAFGRVGLNGDAPLGDLRLLAACAFRREMVGMGGETEGIWPSRLSAAFRLGRRGLELDGLFLKAGVSVSRDGPTWWICGVGFGLRFQNMWRLELIVDTADAVRDEPELYDYRISVSLAREVFKASNAMTEEDLEEDAEEEAGDVIPFGDPVGGTGADEGDGDGVESAADKD